MALTLIGIAPSVIISGLTLASLCVAIARQAGSVPITLPWPLIGAILTGYVLIAVLTSALPAWFQLQPRHRPAVSIPT
jgi:hypothetical protein